VLRPAQDAFERLARPGSLVPVVREILADLDTPLSLFRKVDDGRSSFLLESVEGGEKWGRYSFIGVGARAIFRARGREVEWSEGGEVRRETVAGDPLVGLRERLARSRPLLPEGVDLPRFMGGAVGMVGYEWVRFVERIPDENPDEVGLPDLWFVIPDVVIVYDRVRHTAQLVRMVEVREGDDPAALYRETAGILERLGHTVVEADPGIDGAAMAEAFIEMWAALAAHAFSVVLDTATERMAVVRRMRRVAGDRRTMRLIALLDQRESGRPAFEPFTFALAERSSGRSQADLQNAEASLQAVAHQTGDFLTDHDVFLTPVLGSPPVSIGTFDQTLPWDELIEMVYRYVAFTPLGNFAGLPAMSVPLHWTPDDLPAGSHFLGRFGSEEVLLSLAAQLERAQPWVDRRPAAPASVR